MPTFSRASLGAGLITLSLITGLAANAEASTEFSARGAHLASTAGRPSPDWHSFSGFAGLAASAVSELLSGPIAALGVGLAFELADYYSCEPDKAYARALSDADFRRNAEANFDSEVATAS